MTSIVYALVARGNVILTEYIVGDFTGNFAAVNRLLSKLESQKVIEESKSYVFESKDPETGRSSKYAFHYIYRNHLIFLALTTLECSKSAVMQFLGNVHRSFIGKLFRSTIAVIIVAMRGCSMLRDITSRVIS